MNISRLTAVCAVLLCAIPFNPLLRAEQKARITDQASPAETVSFDVYLPHGHREALEKVLTDLHTPGSPSYHKWLTPAEFQKQFGLAPAKIRAIESELSSYGLNAVQVSPHRIHVTGAAAQVQAAFNTTLSHATKGNGRRAMVTSSPLSLPKSVTDAEGLVLAFSGQQRMQIHPHPVALPENRTAQNGGYWFDDLKQAYSWPSYKVVSGKGATIGILMAGGVDMGDMRLYFNHEKIAPPVISVENVLGGSPYNPADDGSFEASLDVQQSGGMAPGAKILLYSIPGLYDDDIVGGLIQILEENRVDVVSMSYGGTELAYAAEYNGGVDYSGILRVEDDLFAEGNALGITFVASSGDNGATFVPPLACFSRNAPNPCGKLQPSVNFPASSPHVTGVGGTNLGTVTHPNNPKNLGSAYLYEEAFGDPISLDTMYGTTATGAYWGSGGGDSIVFRKPDYQKLVKTGAKVRTVPDIALHMGGCPYYGPGVTVTCTPEDSYDVEVFGGKLSGVIGTSASAPDFAGLAALQVDLSGGRLGNENYYIYALAAAQKEGLVSDIYRTQIPGYNGLYTSGNNGYNRVLGVGTPYGKNFLLIPNAEAAGKPQTPSNP